ncbi:MAG: TonB-dependent receptor [Odoribacter sp.]
MMNNSIKILLMIILCCSLALSVSAQRSMLSGTVREKSSAATLPGVTVLVKGTTKGCVTDINGRYNLEVNRGDTLLFSFIGMKNRQEILRDSKGILNVEMEPEVMAMDEVLVVAYGTARKESFTGSAEVVGAKQLEKRSVSNITKVLDGTVAGVQTSSGSGQPGGGAEIIIRGIGSINASTTPLYVVDGVPYAGSINALNPDDIESMSVLKDASASALYGARGANGVVIITTKKGKEGKTAINFKATLGIIQRAIPTYEVMDEREFMEANYDFLRFKYQYQDNYTEEEAKRMALAEYMNLLGGEKYNPFNVASKDLIDLETGKMVSGTQLKWQDDWLDEAMRPTPLRQEYLLSAKGGSKSTQYMLSLGYVNEDGLARNSNFERISARVGVDSKLRDWLKCGLSSAFSMTNMDNIPSVGNAQDNIWYSAQLIAPIYPLYMRDDNGALLLKEGEKQFDYGDTRPNQNNFNCVALLFDDRQTAKDDNLSLRSYLELGDKNNESLGFLRDFKLMINLGVDYKMNFTHLFYNPFSGNSVSVGGKMRKTDSRFLSYTFNQLLNYNKKFGQHEIDILAGHEYYDLSNSMLQGERTGFPFISAEELMVGATVSNATSTSEQYRVSSWLSRVNYNFRDKYYFSGSFRTDGSSRFYKDNRWGKFWSLGASWRMSEELFMKDLNWLNNLTLKLSYGQQGNDAVGNYAWQRLYTYGYPNGYYSGTLAYQLENKDLRWEKSKNVNFGLEAKLLNNRLSVSVELYRKQTEDLLLERPLPISSGYEGVFENVGNMLNKGFDITLSGSVMRRENFTWEMSLLASKYVNEVTALVDKQERIVLGSQVIQVGEPIYSYYLSESAGVDATNGDQLYWVKDENGQGMVKTADSELAGRNKKLMGSRIPDVYGSFSNNLSWKGFDLSVLLTYSIGGKILDSSYATLMSNVKSGQNWHKDMNKRWRKEGDVTDVPRLQSGYNIQVTDRHLIDASYLGVKNISLGYTFRQPKLKDAGIEGLRLFFTGDNLYTFTGLKGMDPQYNFTGGQAFTYSSIRTLSFGVDVSF